ncbi:MAG: hypothetical protein LAT76_05365 [Schleiferiaceae bacterium]|nr:hypothetical protein [Schleiferiaceae bacterium]
MATNKLIQLLKEVKGEKPNFETIAEMLFNKCVIKTENATYRFFEIEFYWNAEEHKDESTYKRKHVDPEAGQWFFHYSGVDIAMRNKHGYGGILIRGLYNIATKERVNGPMVSAMKLFSGSNAFAPGSIQTHVKFVESLDKFDITKGLRKNLGKNAEVHDAHLYEYRFNLMV